MPRTFFERFTRIDHLIRTKATGTPSKLSERLEISESILYEYLGVMKDLGAPIQYDRDRETYFYTFPGSF